MRVAAFLQPAKADRETVRAPAYVREFITYDAIAGYA